MPRRRCTRSNHGGPCSTACCSRSFTDSRDFGTKDRKGCREEWRANKAANQANGITEKAYVAQCRSGAAPAQTTAAPPPPPAPAPAPTAATSGQKTAKECREEWRANKAANQANGITEKAYVAQCRSGAAPAQTTAPRRHLPCPTAPASYSDGCSRGSCSSANGSRSSLQTGSSAASDRRTRTQRSGKSGWGKRILNRSRRPRTAVQPTLLCGSLCFQYLPLHGNQILRKHETGAYMCERDATAAGMRAAKNETHP